MGRSTSLAAARMTSCSLYVCPVAQRQLAIDVFHHDNRAVDDDAEVDGSDGEQVGGAIVRVQNNEGE